MCLCGCGCVCCVCARVYVRACVCVAQVLHELMRHADANKDGLLSKEEARCVAVSPPPPHELSREAFQFIKKKQLEAAAGSTVSGGESST
jgi:hypothetical protein